VLPSSEKSYKVAGTPPFGKIYNNEDDFLDLNFGMEF
jgi:hypothetical protein